MQYKEIEKCRVCGNTNLATILDLGIQTLTGVFPKSKTQAVTSGPLQLVKCVEDAAGDFCGLVQLRQTYDLNEMYGDNYGYRSGLNPAMVRHLEGTVKSILERVTLSPGDLIVDIGSNDGTLLNSYPDQDYILLGIDPTGTKFKHHYQDRVQLIPDFFSPELVRSVAGDKKAKIITSIAMFYDLESPLDFMGQVHELLADEGVWVFEQSYMPTMLDVNAYDTICHEHLEYYRLKQIKWMADRVGFKIVDVEFNDTNGGSYAVTVAKSGSAYAENRTVVDQILRDEESKGCGKLDPYEEFSKRAHLHREELLRLIRDIQSQGHTIVGYGASTKGNVVLQFCNITPKEIPFIAEVNEDKFGCFTPGTHIPIIPESEAKAMNPEFFLVMPWHFKNFIVEKEQEYLASGGKLVFPLPSLEVVSK